MSDYRSSREAAERGTAACEALAKKFRMWERKCDTHLQEKAASAAPAAKQAEVTEVKEVSEVKEAKGAQPAASAQPADAAPAAAAAPQPVGPSKLPDVRRDWIQTASDVTVCFYINMKQQIAGSKDHATVSFTPRSLSVSIRLKDGTDYSYTAEPLFGSIVADASSYTVRPMKVEVVLRKYAHGEHWQKLEGTREYADKVAAYPTSNKKKIDWTRESVAEEGEDAKPEGNDALNKLFQDIYTKADEDTRRAMNKSFVESSGTVLSTNWTEVGVKKVDGQPPAGMEEKSW
eukprot:gene10908-16773_t